MPSDYRYDPFNNIAEPVAITGETHIIPSNSPYTIRLAEVPVKESPSTVSLTIGGVAGVEVAAEPAAGEFRCDYTTGADQDDNWNTGLIQFNAADAGKTVVVAYNGMGTLASINADRYPSWWLDRGDGSDGVFNPTANVTISGIKNYTSVNIPAGVTVTVNPWAYIKCQGSFVVAGTLLSKYRDGGVGGGYNSQNAGSTGNSGLYGGAGGAGGSAAGGAGGAGGGSSSVDEFNINLKNIQGLIYRVARGIKGYGASGGGGGKDQGYSGARGGYGGYGGGSLVLVALEISISGTITSGGGIGQAEQAWPGSGGGGGGGGEVLAIAGICNNQEKINATGGGGGAGNGGGNGVKGGDGLAVIITLN